MGQVNMATCEDLVKAIGNRYVVGRRVEKTLILDEFVAVTGLHRKHAMKLRLADAPVTTKDARGQRRRLCSVMASLSMKRSVNTVRTRTLSSPAAGLTARMIKPRLSKKTGAIVG